jgi:hypothetical protein
MGITRWTKMCCTCCTQPQSSPARWCPFTLVPFTPPQLRLHTPKVTALSIILQLPRHFQQDDCPEAGVPGPALLGWFFGWLTHTEGDKCEIEEIGVPAEEQPKKVRRWAYIMASTPIPAAATAALGWGTTNVGWGVKQTYNQDVNKEVSPPRASLHVTRVYTFTFRGDRAQIVRSHYCPKYRYIPTGILRRKVL